MLESWPELLAAAVAVAAIALATAVWSRSLRSRVEGRPRELLEGEEQYRLLFAAAQDAIVILDVGDGRIVDANAAALRLYGYTREEILGLHAIELSADPVRAAAQIAEMPRLASEGVFRTQATHRRKDGAAFPVEITAGSIVLRGRPMVHAVFRDLTERRRAEEARAGLVAELEARNAELERFTYTVSHDLKSPLITIRGFLGLVEQDVERGDREAMRRDLGQVYGATDKMRAMLEDLLSLSTIGRVIEPSDRVDLRELASEAVASVVGATPAGGVEVSIDPGLPTVTGDRARLLEVMQNLVDNAVKFAGARPPTSIEIGVLRADGEDVFHVSDDGPGIEPRYHAKVFGLFERLDAATEGTGIGLALVKRIVEAHGGRVWIDSDGQNGCSFRFTLPQRAAEPGPRPARA